MEAGQKTVLAAQSAAEGRERALLYPSNQLGDQKREYNATLSVASVLRETFFPDKD